PMISPSDAVAAWTWTTGRPSEPGSTRTVFASLPHAFVTTCCRFEFESIEAAVAGALVGLPRFSTGCAAGPGGYPEPATGCGVAGLVEVSFFVAPSVAEVGVRTDGCGVLTGARTGSAVWAGVGVGIGAGDAFDGWAASSGCAARRMAAAFDI